MTQPRAGEEPMRLTSTDPEPAVGTVVRDANGALWRRFDDDRRSWVRADGEDDDAESWIRIAGNNGPVQVVQ